MDGGLYNVSFFMVMNQAKFDSMSDADKAAIDEVSGETLVRMAGQAWDTADEAGLAALEGTVDFHDATEEEMVAIEEMSQPLYDTVRKAFDDKGVDFDAALEMLRSETQAVLSE